MANAKRVAAPVKTAASAKASKAAAKMARASIAFGEREHDAVKVAEPRTQRLRMRAITHSAALARD